MSTGRKKQKERLRPLSMDGISVEDALTGAMDVPAPEQPKKRKARKKAKRKKTPKKR